MTSEVPHSGEAGIEAAALQALQAGDATRARALGKALLEMAPAHAGGWRILGTASMMERRYEDAVDDFYRSLAVAADLGSLLNLTTCQLKLGNLDQALDAGRAAVEMAPQSFHAHLGLAAALHGMRRPEQALEEAETACRLSKGNAAAIIRRGTIHAHLGNYDEAERDLSSVSQDQPLGAVVRFNRSFYDGLAPGAKDAAPLPTEALRTSDGRDARYVVMAGCNADYFLKYGPAFVNSFAENAASRNLLHLHVVDPGPEFDRLLSDIAGRLPRLPLAVTTESAPENALQDPGTRKSFYACARFIHLGSFLAHYGKPVMCVDIDTVFESGMDALLEHVGTRDLGLVQREPVDSPWLDIVANVVIANPTPRAHAYLRGVRAYIRHFLGRRQMPWLLDQTSFYCVLRMMMRFDDAPDIAWLTRDVLTATWHIGHGYDYKLADARFQRHV
jgi:tetratricopeptide (TPR) repeat protein